MEGVAVVSDSLARRLWPGEDAIGKGIRANGNGPPYYRVVGIAADVRSNGFDRPPGESVYFPVVSREGAPLFGPQRAMRVVLRTRRLDAGSVMPRVRQIVVAIDPSVPIANVRTMDELVAQSMARSSFTTSLLATAAFLAILLSAVGLYGVISYGVACRRNELGVRLALGARPAAVRVMVIRETLTLVLIGLSVGAAATLGSTRLLAGFLFGVSARDPATLVGVSAFLMCVGAAAGTIPAWRASRTDPMVALRCE
jgi:predicted lysophospholipase L1 biosynthesis ABC-type transport system permease subunit